MMKSLQCFVGASVIATCLLVASTEAGNNGNSPRSNGIQRTNSGGGSDNCQNSYKFNMFILDLQLSSGFCAAHKQECAVTPSAKFMIHGLWPADNGEGVTCCCAASYTPQLMRNLNNELNTYWESLTKNQHLWAHEWKKHGSCAIKAKGFEHQVLYFQQSLALFKKLNLAQVLQRNGIVFSDDEPVSMDDLSEVLSSLQGGKDVTLRCEDSDDFDLPVLTGVRLCFTRDLKPTDCTYSRTRRYCMMPQGRYGRQSRGPNRTAPKEYLLPRSISAPASPARSFAQTVSAPSQQWQPVKADDLSNALDKLKISTPTAQGAWGSNTSLAQKISNNKL